MEQEVFENIASHIYNSQINGNWDYAVLKFILIDNSVEFNLNFYTNKSAQSTKLINAFDCSTKVHQLYDLTVTHPLEHQNWNRAIFTLYPSDEFEIEYIWDEALEQELNNLEIA